jgi:hypothetical protein
MPAELRQGRAMRRSSNPNLKPRSDVCYVWQTERTSLAGHRETGFAGTLSLMRGGGIL